MSKLFAISISFFFFMFLSNTAFAQPQSRELPDFNCGWRSDAMAAGCTDFRQGGVYHRPRYYHEREERYNEYDRNNVIVVLPQQGGYYGYGAQENCPTDSNHPIAAIGGAVINALLNTSHARVANELGRQCFGSTLTTGIAQVRDNHRAQAEAVRAAEVACTNAGGRVVGHQNGVQCEQRLASAQPSSQYVQQCRAVADDDRKIFEPVNVEQERAFLSTCSGDHREVKIARNGSGNCYCQPK